MLLSGDHARIKRWRDRESIRVTLANRPELLDKVRLTEEEQDWAMTLGWEPAD